MSSKAHVGAGLAAVIIAGCGSFFSLFIYAATQIYTAFKDSGMPVWSGEKIIAVIDPFWPLVAMCLLAAFVAGLGIWRTVVSLRKGKGDSGNT